MAFPDGLANRKLANRKLTCVLMARTIKNDKVEKQIVVAVVPQKSKENEKYRKIIGGMAGGVVEACCLHPLDTIKTRIQLSRGGSAKTAKASRGSW